MPTSEQIVAARHAQIRQLRAAVAEAEQVAQDLRQERDEAAIKLSVLERRIEQLRRRAYGTSAECHHPGQQSIALGLGTDLSEPSSDTQSSTWPSTREEAALQSAATAAAPAAESSLIASAQSLGKRPQAGRHPGRRALPADAEVIVEEVTVPEQERLDAHGQPLPLLGYRTTDKWDYRVGTYLIRRYRRALYGRPFCAASDRIVAPAPACLIPHGKMTDAALIHTVIEKFADHLPLYRQQQRAGRVGIHLSRATLVGHVAAVATAVQPIVDALADEVRTAPYLHLDDTPVQCLDPGRGRTATARIWVYRSATATVFRCTPTRAGRHPAEFLGDYRGFIVADAYAGHERLYRSAGSGLAKPVGCWAHVRRKFHELEGREPFAWRMVELIQHLYAVEDDLRLISDDHQRHRIRQRHAVPMLAQIRQQLDHARITALPSSALGQAIAYALTRWPTLVTYTQHGFLPIDNNPAENAIRPWAIGRKNLLFFGSLAGGERAAAISTIIENCRMQDIDPYGYLLETVAALHRGCTDYHALTPHAAAQAQDARSA